MQLIRNECGDESLVLSERQWVGKKGEPIFTLEEKRILYHEMSVGRRVGGWVWQGSVLRGTARLG